MNTVLTAALWLVVAVSAALDRRGELLDRERQMMRHPSMCSSLAECARMCHRADQAEAALRDRSGS